MVLHDALSAVDAAKQFYNIILAGNNFNRFYDKTVTTSEEHNIDLQELPRYLRPDRKWELAKCIYIYKSILPGNLT